MSVQYNADFFRARLHQSLSIAQADGIVLVLVSVTESARSTPEHPSFSLLLRGPLAAPLEQQIYGFTLADGHALDMFIVPVARDAQGMQYEAVFN